MDTPSSPSRSFRWPFVRRFTPVELIVIILLTLVLAGLLIPFSSRTSDGSNYKKVSAKSTMIQVVSAVKSYQMDYGTYPVETDAIYGTDITFDDSPADGKSKGGHNGTLFNVLRALNNASQPNAGPEAKNLNSRHVVYFEYKDVKHIDAPLDGFIPVNATGVINAKKVPLQSGDLVDPWGNLYRIRIDSGSTSKVCDPFVTSDLNDPSASHDPKLLSNTVIVWSIGGKGTQFIAGSGDSSDTFESSGNVASWK